MGCSNSTMVAESSVVRCKSRKRFVEEAVSYRHAFAAAHASYVRSLKDTGASIRQFADNEPPRPVPSTYVQAEQLQPPPKPPVSEVPLRPLPRAQSMPPIPLSSTEAASERLKSSRRAIKPVQEEQEYYGNDSQRHSLSREPEISFFGQTSPREPSDSLLYVFDSYHDPIMPEKTSEVENEGPLEEEFEQKEEERTVGNLAETAYASKPKKVEEKPEPAVSEKVNEDGLQLTIHRRNQIGKKDLGVVLGLIDDEFLASYEAGKKVSRLLEVRKLHYHTYSGDFDSGIKSHRAKVSSILTWGKSSPTIPFASRDVNANSQNDDDESHASTLDKLLAWEKKLYDEVKAGEAIRLDLERRCGQLKSQKERGEDAVKIDKTKALVKSLQTKYIVEFQAVDSAISEVQRLRDEHLYPQLVELVHGLTEMWTSMSEYHKKQSQMVDDLIALELVSSADDTSGFHRKITDDLRREINDWHQSLKKLIKTQKDYPTALHEWLQLNITQIENDVKDKQASPQKLDPPPVYIFCKAWIEGIKVISGQNVMKDLEKFSNILQNMVTKQEEELKQKEKYEALEKEYERKKLSLENFERKYGEKHMEMKGTQENQELVARNPVHERKSFVELLKKGVDEEKERHVKLCEQNSTMILKGLQDGLPDVLRSITTFSDENAKAYAKLQRDLTITAKIP